MRARFNLDVRTRSTVEAIDRVARKIRIRELASGRQYEETYDKLILAPGAAPLRPPIPGVDLPGIFTLRNLQDADQIKQRLDQGVRQAVVVGAGFIGLEMVENLVRHGISTTLVELQDQVLPPLDKEMTTPIAKCLAAEGVTLILGQSAARFEPTLRRTRRVFEVRRAAARATGRFGSRRATGEQAGGRRRAGNRAPRRHPSQ